MTVASMTGFARASGSDGQWRWVWEARSVNGRGLDLRLRLPPGLDRLDQPVRGAATKRFQRGSLSLTLTLERVQAAVPLRLNRQRLDEYLAIIRALGAESGLAPARLDGVLALRGVIETAEELATEDAQALARFDAAVVATLDETLAALDKARAAEGRRLAAVFEGLLDAIAALSRDARTLAAAQPGALRERLMAQLAELAAVAPPERLAQEVALLATKADVREELDRLDAHVEQARGLLAGSAPAGRKLEFLAQEFNREANTLCSKSSDLALTRLGLDLKVAIDRLREQAANLE